MYKIETHKRINQTVEVFHLFGFWRNEDETSVFRQMRWKLMYLIFEFSFAMSMVFGGLLSDDKDESVYLASAGTVTLVLIVKVIYILWKKEKILAFILELGVHSVEDQEEFIKLNNKVKKLMKFSSSFMLMTFLACVFIVVFSLPVISTEKRLPFNIWLPLDWRNDTFSYWIAFVFVSISLTVSFISVLLNVILWYLMMNCAIKYEILGSQFRTLQAPPTKGLVKKHKMSEKEKDKLFVQELIDLIKTHQNIQKTIDEFKSCFANLFFAQITTSAICICGSVYVLTFGNENLPVTMVNVVILTYNIFDIFMVTYFGNEVKLSSDRLSYCLFESNWIERSQSNKKYIIIITEVLKQPHELVIGKLYPLNLETFTSIVNGAYSMFNILQNMNSK